MLILLNSSEELEPRERSDISEVTEQVRGRAGTCGDHLVCLPKFGADLPFTFRLPLLFFVLFWCRTKGQEKGENLFEKIIKGKEKKSLQTNYQMWSTSEVLMGQCVRNWQSQCKPFLRCFWHECRGSSMGRTGLRDEVSAPSTRELGGRGVLFSISCRARRQASAASPAQPLSDPKSNA